MRKCYLPKIRNYKEKLTEKITFENFSSQKVININDIKEQIFVISKNEKEIKGFIKEYESIILTNTVNKKDNFKTINLKKDFNIGEKLCKRIPKCICFQWLIVIKV